MSSEEEPSIIDYARYYGLSRNHLETNPLDLLPPPEDTPQQSVDDSIWEQLRAGAASPPPERLQAVKEASALLASINPKKYEECEFEGIDPLPKFHIRNFKHELPLLRTDHELDMLSFVQRLSPNLADEFIPFEKVDNEQGEGFGWPSSYDDLPETVFQRAQNEKLELPKDIFAYLRSVLDTRAHDDEPTFEYEVPMYRRNRLRDPITPPLLPRSSTPQAYEPSSETGHLDVLPERSSPTRQQAETLEKRLLENDALIPVKRQLETTDESSEAGMLYSINVGDIYSPLKGIDSTQSPASCKRSRRQDLKVDGPLTPPASERCPPWDSKKVSVSEVLQDVMPHLPPPIPAPEQISSEDIDMLFAEHIAPIAAKADRAIEQEQLQEADTTSRVQVPTMDFTKPIPPWHIAPSENIHDWKKRFLHEIKESHLNIPLWLQEGPTKEGLSWAPFPISLGRFDLKETIEDDGSLTAFITDPEAIDPETLTWKPPGLRIFDESHNSEEEELAYGVFPPAGDVDSLIKERVLELQNEDELDSGLSSARKPEASTEQFTDGPTRLKGRAASGNRQAVPPTVDDPAQIAKFSAVNALDQFLGIRKGELSRSKGPTENLASASALKVSKETVESADIIVSEKSTLAAPRPKFQVPDCPHYFVASTSFLSNRRLAHQVKNLYPSAIIIERDFTIYGLRSPDAEKNLHTARTGPEIPSDEADLILSPGTGLIITSLQKIKQQSLPGEVTRSPVRARIQRTAPRYERLVVLVSIHSASSDDGAGIRGSLEESDCEALVSLTAYLDHLQTLSESELVLADGDTTALAVWVVSLMVRYSSEASITLLQEETQWEVFLRQAGMNAFAAQVVVAVMKAVKGKDGHPLGLRDLVFMSPEERYRRFEGLLGGRGMLERVGRVLDARW